ncbi:MAG TPA: hypothetical protein VIF11_23345 [Methylomirabilota bacterium]
METATQERTTRTFEPATMSNGDAAARSIGLTQRLMAPLAELSIAAAREQARLGAELHIVVLESLHDAHLSILRRPAWADGLMDPWSLYHRGVLETLESTRRALTVVGASARLVTQAADRLHSAAMDAGRRIQETLESSTGTREPARR